MIPVKVKYLHNEAYVLYVGEGWAIVRMAIHNGELTVGFYESTTVLSLSHMENLPYKEVPTMDLTATFHEGRTNNLFDISQVIGDIYYAYRKNGFPIQGFLRQEGQELRVAAYPALWYVGGYYSTYKGNTFVLSGTNDFIWLGFPPITINTLEIRNAGIHTDFTAEFFKDWSNITEVDLSNNLISILEVGGLLTLEILTAPFNQINVIDLQALTLLTDLNLEGNWIQALDLSNKPYLNNVVIGGNLLDGLANSEVLLALNSEGVEEGFLSTSIYGGGSLTSEGFNALQGLINKEWTIEGLFVLDNYQGAAAAYSLELLSFEYDGFCVTVRRDSDNAVLDIGFENGVLDTATLSTFCSGANGYVTKWYDQSGNGNDATQTTASRQPKIFDSVNGVVTINGKPAIYSNEDYLENLTKTASASSTAYIVHKGDTGVTSNVSIVGFPANGYSAHIGLYYWGTDANKYFGFNSWNNDSFGYSNGKADFESHSLWTGLFKEGIITTNGVRLFKDGVEKSLSQVKGTSNNRTIEDGIYIGKGGTISGNQEGNGYYQEIVIYDNELTNRLPIENNINDRYQIYWSGASQRLLDTYSGATAAYSLEAINAGYTGAIIQVRRDSDNAVLDIGANYDGSLDVDKLTNFCNGANGFVTIWYDQSNSNNNLTQNTASAQPKIYDSVTGVITENGKPAIYTDGIDDELTSDILSLSNPTTQFFVFKTLVNTTHKYVGGLYNGQDTAGTLLGTFSGDNLYFAQQGPDFTPSVPHNQRQLLVTAKSSTTGINWQLFKNGGEITNSGENIGTATGNKIVLGNRNTLSFFGENYFQEYILYNSDETGNRAAIENNINQRYNIYQ